jgi:type III restriction enzyme
MELKEYQQTVLDTLDSYLDELLTQQAKAEKIRQANKVETDPDLIRQVPDFPARAWERLKEQNRLPPFRAAISYSPRKDGLGDDVPDICLKVPTGGGKTLLAASAVSRIMGRYLRRNYGFVLWIVPNEAIYAQTKKQLNNREHPYRQILDRAAAGRVKFLEKSDPLNKLDVESNLCVMLLMLQAANRETKETLKMFRDRGSVHGFFPPADDVLAHFKLLGEVKNLSCYGNRDNMGATAHDSLGNVLRVLRPVVVMDEGHKSYTASAMATLYDFNPSFVLELSATPQDRIKDAPPKYANWLADVRGVELQREEMIKLPINVKVKAGDDWRECLSESLDHLKILQAHADKLRANTARYIRPILLVQVERTGRDQRESQFVHSEDVREFLLSLGMDASEIAVKTAEKNELSQPENLDLLSETCPVRAIITKQALQEGWDCPFAYVLCTLAANRNLKAMTQLVGRILRQPANPLLNECYVFCHHAKTKDVIDAIKKGLEQDGMADVAGQIRETATNGKKDAEKRKLARREKFRGLDIYLPLVNWVEGDESRPLDYERDVLSRLDWLKPRLKDLAEKLATEVEAERSQMVRLSLVPEPGREFLKQSDVESVQEAARFDPVYATRLVVDIVPNAWVARAMIGELLEALAQRGFDEAKLGAVGGYILEELRKWVIQQRDLLAEEQFIGDVNDGRIQFRLRADRALWQLPKEMATDRLANAAQLPRNSGAPIERSVFAPVYKDDYNRDEGGFACYLDELQALRWWHRNVAKAGGYWIQGWKKHKVYPDFIFAHERKGKTDLIRVWETKGDQLEGNLDTKYKRKLLELTSKHYRAEDGVRAGKLELVGRAGESVECDLVLMSEWKTEVSKKLQPAE